MKAKNFILICYLCKKPIEAGEKASYEVGVCAKGHKVVRTFRDKCRAEVTCNSR